MKRYSKHAVTIHDVAEAAGVSISTVSRVLNNKDDAAPETYEHVRMVIEDLEYVSNLAARGMRSRHTGVIGIIKPDVASFYSATILRGVNQAITEINYDLIVYTNGDISKNASAYQEKYYVSLFNGSVIDGVIVVTPAATDFSTTTPVVAIDPINESPDCHAIISNNYQGALQVMSSLIKLGHRRIGFITGWLELVSAERRLTGYKDSLIAEGHEFDEDLIQIGDYTTPTAVECTRRLLSLDNPPTAIFASNDMSAIGVYQAAEEKGLRIPEDLSVVGFDNLRESMFLSPQLTTIDQYIEEMGSKAIELIVKLIRGEELEDKLHKI